MALAVFALYCLLVQAVLSTRIEEVDEVDKALRTHAQSAFPESLTLHMKSVSVNDALLKSLSDAINTPAFNAAMPDQKGLRLVTMQIPGIVCNSDKFGFVSLAGENYFIYIHNSGVKEKMAGKLWAIRAVFQLGPWGPDTTALKFGSKATIVCPAMNLMYPTTNPTITPYADFFAWRHRGVSGAGAGGAFVYRAADGTCFRLDIVANEGGASFCAAQEPFRATYVGPPSKKKSVLVVIDLQDGYNAGLVATSAGKGGLDYLNQMHEVDRSYELGAWNEGKEMKPVSSFAEGSKHISYNKGWNTGLPEEVTAKVVKRVNEVVAEGGWDLITYTHDYLDPKAKGVFPLDEKAWSDESKEIALVPYEEFLTIVAHGSGTDTDHRLELNPHCASHGPGVFQVNDVNVMCFRKQVDDAFNDERADTGGPASVDPDDNGAQNRNGHVLLAQLAEAGFGPDQATLYFSGVVTSRCVQSSLVHACQMGYKTWLIEGATADISDADHEKGMQAVRSGCPTATITL